MAGHGVTEAAKHTQREALAEGRSGYLCGFLSGWPRPVGDPRE
jgi:hypothetical protein